MFEGIVKLTSVILGGLTVLLTMVVIGLIVKIKKHQKGTFTVLLYFHIIFLLNDVRPVHNFCFYHLAHTEEQNPQQTEVSFITSNHWLVSNTVFVHNLSCER